MIASLHSGPPDPTNEIADRVEVYWSPEKGLLEPAYFRFRGSMPLGILHVWIALRCSCGEVVLVFKRPIPGGAFGGDVATLEPEVLRLG